MNQIKTKNTVNHHNKAIIFGMVLVFLCLHVGFHPTYFQYFPEFKKFTWLHHIHGTLMASWIFLLVIQPILIHKKKFLAHRFVGRLSYITAPLMIISMFLVLRFTYHKHILDISMQEEMSNQAPIIMQLLSFTILYVLAIIYRGHTFYHVRFMIGTALLLMIPIVGRIFFEYFGAIVWYDLYLSVGFATVLTLNDVSREQDWKPYAIVTVVLLSILIVYLGRKTEALAAFSRLWANTFY